MVASPFPEFLKLRTERNIDSLRIAAFEGEEAISELFRYRVSLTAPVGTSIPFDAVVNKSMTIEIALPGGPPRFIHGVVQSFAEADDDDAFAHFEAELVPPHWRLTRTVDSRIFQQKTVKEILAEVLKETSVRMELKDAYCKQNICMQYGESNFAFASRLMEENGIHYYFLHSDGACEMVLSDSSPSSPPIEGGAIQFDAVAGDIFSARRIHRWRKRQEARSAKVVCQDAHFQLPGQSLAAIATAVLDVEAGKVKHSLQVGNSDWELFDGRAGYAHMFDELTTGLDDVFKQKDVAARIRLEQETSEAIRIDGAGSCPAMTPGCHFTLQGRRNADGDYLITRVRHRATIADPRSGSEKSSYANEFSATPIALAYRPAPKTPKPIMHGTQTATVVGPPDEVVHTDKYGRIKVQFHWDRYGKSNADRSCWLRPFTPNAGRGMGMLAIPEVGQEVMVVFHDGDPDEPHVIGAAYNPKNMPPANLPEERSRTYLKTKSFHGDGTEVSGLAIENLPGREMLHTHSQKDMMTTSENNHYHSAANGILTSAGTQNVRRTGGFHHPARTPAGSGAGGDNDLSLSNDPKRLHESPSFSIEKEKYKYEHGNDHTFYALLDSLDPPTRFSVGLERSEVVGFSKQSTIGINMDEVLGSRRSIYINPFDVPGVHLLADLPILRRVANAFSSSEHIYGSYTRLTTMMDTSLLGGDQLEFHYKGQAGVNKVMKVVTNLTAALYSVEMIYSMIVDLNLLPHNKLTNAVTSIGDIAMGAAEIVGGSISNRVMQKISNAKTIVAKESEQAFLAEMGRKALLGDPWLEYPFLEMEAVDETVKAKLIEDLKGMGSRTDGATKQTYLDGTIGYSCANFTVHTRPGLNEMSNICLNAGGGEAVAGVNQSGNAAVIGANSAFLQSGHAIVSCRSAEDLGNVTIRVGAAGKINIGNSAPGEPNDIAIQRDGIVIRSLERITLRCGESYLMLTEAGIVINGPIVAIRGPQVSVSGADTIMSGVNLVETFDARTLAAGTVYWQVESEEEEMMLKQQEAITKITGSTTIQSDSASNSSASAVQVID